jgi:predicted amidohydrolase YtcJ
MISLRHSRRDFLAMIGAASVPGTAGFAAGFFDPDLIVYNARAYTIDPARPKAQAFAVKSGRFVAVGSNDEIKALRGRRTEMLDAKQMTVTPGFIDCHNHASGTRLLYDVLVGNPFDVEFVTIDSIVEKLRARAKITPPGTWVEGFFFDDTKVKDKRPLTAKDLDEVSREHPVAVHHRGGHTAFFNHFALNAAGISRETNDPPGGTFDRDQNGDLTGRLTDAATDMVEKFGARESFSADELATRERAGMAHISKQFARCGLTGVHHEAGSLQALQDIRQSGELLHRISYEPIGKVLEDLIASGIKSGFGDDWIKIGATFEHFTDGSFSERTMALSTPYPNRTPAYQGNIMTSQDDLNAWVERMMRAGIQVNCHANGDVAIGMMMTAVETAQAKFPVPDARPKITHCTLLNADLIARIKTNGAVPALFTSYAYYNPDKFHFYGEAMMQHCMAFRDLIDAGVPVAAGSDFDPGPFAPLLGIQAMVTRTGWNGEVWGANQRIQVSEALKVYTINGAYNSHEEQIKGSITPGKLADFVILSDDPHKVDPLKIKDIAIARTVVGGKTTYQVG